MPYAFTLDSPVPVEIFKQVNANARAALNGNKPEGLIAHVAYLGDGLVRHVDVWNDRASFDAFEAVLTPFIMEAAAATGASPAGALFTEVDCVDAWLGTATTAGYAHVQRVPATPEMYAQIKGKLGEEPPAGLVMHIAHVVDGGLQYSDVWETEAAWSDFRENTLHPIVTEVLAAYGIQQNEDVVVTETIDVVDTWK